MNKSPLGKDPAVARVLLAHGAGSSSTHPHLLRLAALLQTARNHVTRFDFPYRLIGRQLPDKMPMLLNAMWQQVAATQHFTRPILDSTTESPTSRPTDLHTHSHTPSHTVSHAFHPTSLPATSPQPLFLAGHSMGGRVALRVAAGEGQPPSDLPLPPIAGVLLFSYPLRAATGKGALRLDGFAECESRGIPMLLFCGERDALAPPELRQSHLAGYSKLTHPRRESQHSRQWASYNHREPP